jgi:hypothetical protein
MYVGIEYEREQTRRENLVKRMFYRNLVNIWDLLIGR